MQRIIDFVKTYPILTIVGVVVIFLAASYLMSSVWTNLKVAYYERQNAKLEKQYQELGQKNQELEQSITRQTAVIEVKEQELQEKDELLQAATARLESDKKALADVAQQYNAARNDLTPMSGTELRQRLCNLYPDQCR